MGDMATLQVPTGLEGLDEILDGGLPRGRMFLIQGNPGAGKSTLALQFLLEGARRGEACLYITLSESKASLLETASSHGWALSGIQIVELGSLVAPAGDRDYTLFHPSEIEVGKLTREVADLIERTKPRRIVFDSLSEYQLLVQDALHLRQQVLALKQIFSEGGATVFLLRNSGTDDLFLQSLVDGVIELDRAWPTFGDARHHLRILKMRHVAFLSGFHDYSIRTGGLSVFPRLQVSKHHATFAAEPKSSGLPELDQLLGGGLDRGASILVIGATGTGKSVLAAQFATAAALRGEHVAYFAFDEVIQTALARSDGLHLAFREQVDRGIIMVQQVDPGSLAPWEFARAVLDYAERLKTTMIVIDSLNGYLNAMPDERALTLQLHELFACLAQLGVITVSTMIEHGLVGEHLISGVDISYLTDTVILLRFFEHASTMRRAISVVKRRRGPHENVLRELRIGPAGICVGQPLTEFQGVLTGNPLYVGDAKDLLISKDDERRSA